VGVEIAEQRVVNLAQAFRPGLQARHTVHAQAQNLGPDPVKPLKGSLV
jgi:hypothetical protein